MENNHRIQYELQPDEQEIELKEMRVVTIEAEEDVGPQNNQKCQEPIVPRKTNIGLLYMLIGSLSMSMMNLSAKFVKQETSVAVLEVCYFRSLVMLLGCYAHTVLAQTTVLDIPTKNKGKWVFLRAFFGFFSQACQFIGIYMLPLSISMVLYFTQPISAAVLNYILNKEKLNSLEILSIFSAMLGVIVLTVP